MSGMAKSASGIRILPQGGSMNFHAMRLKIAIPAACLASTFPFGNSTTLTT